MVASDPTHISYFEIGTEYSWAVYNNQVDVGVTSDGHAADIQKVVAAGNLPRGGRRPHRNPERPERFLDIRETRGDGVYAYVFYLNATCDGVQRLEFASVGDPFKILPMNSGGNESFLTGIKRHESRWASFHCNLKDVRDSDLAKRIARLPIPPEPLIITIPITFNLIDPKLGASPWVVPGAGDEDDGHGHGLQTGMAARTGAKSPAPARGRSLLTHGGVHPSAVTYLSIPL
jgi:hypothetical protein